jgi:transcriptional regulator with XRE-family HTH domain
MEVGLTQRQLAARTGTSHSTISRIERGQHSTAALTMRRLAAGLGMRLVIAVE